MAKFKRLDREIQEIESTGVGIRTNTRVDSLDALFEERYHAVLVAVGTHEGQKLPIPGADHDGVLVGVDFLRDVNLGKEVKVGRRVLVLWVDMLPSIAPVSPAASVHMKSTWRAWSREILCRPPLMRLSKGRKRVFLFTLPIRSRGF